MKCRDLRELLSAYADNELPRTQKEFVEEHWRPVLTAGLSWKSIGR